MAPPVVATVTRILTLLAVVVGGGIVAGVLFGVITGLAAFADPGGWAAWRVGLFCGTAGTGGGMLAFAVAAEDIDEWLRGDA